MALLNRLISNSYNDLSLRITLNYTKMMQNEMVSIECLDDSEIMAQVTVRNVNEGYEITRLFNASRIQVHQGARIHESGHDLFVLIFGKYRHLKRIPFGYIPSAVSIRMDIIDEIPLREEINEMIKFGTRLLRYSDQDDSEIYQTLGSHLNLHQIRLDYLDHLRQGREWEISLLQSTVDKLERACIQTRIYDYNHEISVLKSITQQLK